MTDDDRIEVLKRLPIENTKALSEELNIDFIKLKVFLKDIGEPEMYEKKLKFARENNFRFVSDAIDFFGKFEFERRFYLKYKDVTFKNWKNG